MEANITAFLTSLESDPAYSLSTRLAYASDLRVFLGYLRKTLGRTPEINDLNSRQIADFLNQEHQSGRRKSTLMRRRASLRRFKTYLQQVGADLKDEAGLDDQLIDQAIQQVSASPSYSCLTPQQIERLWSIIGGSSRPRARRDQAILSLLLETGLSVGTLVALNLADLDLFNGCLRMSLENGQDTWLPLGSSGEFLDRYIKEGRPQLHHHPDEPALFISQLGRRISRQGVWQILRHWGRMVDPAIDLSPRLVRHTAAIKMYVNGRSMGEIQTLLGHSNPLSTQALLRRLESTI
jgi:integrase/recombinase XerD